MDDGKQGQHKSATTSKQLAGSKSPDAAKTYTIVLVCPRNNKASASVSDPFLLSLIGQLGDVLSKFQCDLLVATFDKGAHDWKARYLDSGKAQGIIVFGHGTFPESIELLTRQGAPFVVWGSTTPASDFCTVGSDNEKGGYLATNHLLSIGRRRIAFLGDYSLPEIKERFEGYKRALEYYSVPFDPCLVAKTHLQSYSTFDSIYNRLVEKNITFDGIFASTDIIGLDAITILKKLGLVVPDNVSIVGFDNIPNAVASSPTLTTISQDVNFAAREIVARLFGLMRLENPGSVRLPVKLVERGSCKPDQYFKGIINFSRGGVIEYLDAAGEKLLGYSLRELLGKDLGYILPDSSLLRTQEDSVDLAALFSEIRHGIPQPVIVETQHGQHLHVEIVVNKGAKDSPEGFACVFWEKVTDANGLIGSAGYHHDVEQAVAQRTEALAKVAEKMEQLALEDALTGLSNRRYFDEKLKQEIDNAARRKEHVALALFDVDFFKAYNDNYGHLAGDACLKKIAALLSLSFQRASDTVARYGGEEFAIIMPSTDPSDVNVLVERALRRVREARLSHDYSLVAEYVTLSCGIYTGIPSMTCQPDNIIWLADKALYEAKGAGRNCVVHEQFEASSNSALG